MATQTKRQKARANRQKAMSHPLRAEILLILSERTASPSEMEKMLNEPVGDISHHTKQLVKLGCAELVEEQKVRGAVKHLYRATERHLVDTEEWEELAPVIAEDLTGEFMQKILDDFVLSAKAKLVGSDANFHLTRTRHVFDKEGRREALEIHERARLEIAEVEARSAGRLAKSGEPGIPFSSSQGCFEVPAT